MRGLVIVLTLPASTGTAKVEVGSVVGRGVGSVGWVGCGGVMHEASAAASQRCLWGTPPCQPA
eukprot:scaffold146303_cov28-Attheya_sp.AAC.1